MTVQHSLLSFFRVWRRSLLVAIVPIHIFGFLISKTAIVTGRSIENRWYGRQPHPTTWAPSQKNNNSLAPNVAILSRRPCTQCSGYLKIKQRNRNHYVISLNADYVVHLATRPLFCARGQNYSSGPTY